ncbi:MAG: BCAM0308 family protein [Armatimonadota bacterium]
MSSRERLVHIRRNIENNGDPYLNDLKPDEVAVCRECRSVYAGNRWELPHQAGRDLAHADHVVETLCPACRKIRDRMPGGIVILSGGFLAQRKDEVVNLIHNENREAMEINPLERIMDIEASDEGLTVFTTNEKLAQKIGRAMHKAYDGTVEYKWSEDNKLVRVNWYRD